MTQIDIVKAIAQLTSLLARAIGGEEILITKDDLPIVKLVPMLKKDGGRRQPGSRTIW